MINTTKNTFYLLILSLAFLWSCEPETPFDHVEQFEKEQAAIEQYLADNGLTAQTDTLGSELKYIIEQQGTGEHPETTDTIFVSYSGKLLSTGEEFDASDSSFFILNGLIPGWQILLPHLREGGSMKMFVPSFYAYGRNGSGNVPGNSTLMFDVTLNKIMNPFDFEQLRIDQYLQDNNLEAEVDSVTGMRYVLVEPGQGASPTDTSTVNVDYEGRYLNDRVFDTGVGAEFDLTGLIRGWQYLMPYVKEGGTILMFIPSRYAYGTRGNSVIPPNSTIIFEVTLNTVVVD